MSLNELDDLKRISFLKNFVLQLIIESTKDERIKKLIEIEKIKKKLNLEDSKKEKINIKLIKSPINPIISNNTPSKPLIPSRIINNSRPYIPVIVPQTKEINSKMSEQKTTSELIPGVGMKRIEPLIRDPNIRGIECSGSGKNLIVKFRNKMNTSKIILTEEDIKRIIEYFSTNARIPVMGGILKAAVGSLIISAVISEYSGSKFIISKKSPYEIIG